MIMVNVIKIKKHVVVIKIGIKTNVHNHNMIVIKKDVKEEVFVMQMEHVVVIMV